MAKLHPGNGRAWNLKHNREWILTYTKHIRIGIKKFEILLKIKLVYNCRRWYWEVVLGNGTGKWYWIYQIWIYVVIQYPMITTKHISWTKNIHIYFYLFNEYLLPTSNFCFTLNYFNISEFLFVFQRSSDCHFEFH